MLSFVICYLIGDLLLQNHRQLPSRHCFIMIFLLMLACCWVWLLKRHGIVKNIIGLCLGFVWSGWHAQARLAVDLPLAWEAHPLVISGHIVSMPIQRGKCVNFLFIDEKIGVTIALSSTDINKRFVVGDEWRFLVKLKSLHAIQNPYSFDYEKWAFQRGIRASGYLLISNHDYLMAHHWYRYPLEHIRQRIQTSILKYMPHTSSSPWLLALMLGDRYHVNAMDWDVLRKTGTNHLMAIAGLHIGILALLIKKVFDWCWRRYYHALLKCPASIISYIIAAMFAMLYAMLAGLSLPTQRAFIMLALHSMACLMRRQAAPWLFWAMTMLFILLVDPFAVLTESFWLSFGTIALMIYGMNYRLAPTGWWWEWGRLQWVLGFGLIPTTLLFYQECSLASFIANTLAIPWLSIFVLPWCFASLLCLIVFPFICHTFLIIADDNLRVLWWLLTKLAYMKYAAWSHASPDVMTFILGTIGVLLLMLPRGSSGRWLGLVWLIPLWMHQSISTPKMGEFNLTLLDVGQGLSAVIETQHHLLVFDTGAKIGINHDMGRNVVLPFLQNIKKPFIDRLVISHPDNDHSGGATSIIEHIPVHAVVTSVPGIIPNITNFACNTGQHWAWDGVEFTFLYPPPSLLGLDNDSSCVLKVSDGVHNVLLTGDIERRAEEWLVDHLHEQLKSEVLLAPHHGSKTSGLPAFVEAVNPVYVLYAVGYRNRYHFPHPTVQATYAKIHAIQLDSVHSGAISFCFRRQEKLKPPTQYRLSHHRYWFD